MLTNMNKRNQEAQKSPLLPFLLSLVVLISATGCAQADDGVPVQSAKSAGGPPSQLDASLGDGVPGRCPTSEQPVAAEDDDGDRLIRNPRSSSTVASSLPDSSKVALMDDGGNAMKGVAGFGRKQPKGRTLTVASGTSTDKAEDRIPTTTGNGCGSGKKHGGTTKIQVTQGQPGKEFEQTKGQDGEVWKGESKEDPAGDTMHGSRSRVRREAEDFEEAFSEDAGEYPGAAEGGGGEYDENGYEVPQIGESRMDDGGSPRKQYFSKRPKYYPDWGPKRTWRINMMRVWGKRGLYGRQGGIDREFYY